MIVEGEQKTSRPGFSVSCAFRKDVTPLYVSQEGTPNCMKHKFEIFTKPGTFDE